MTVEIELFSLGYMLRGYRESVKTFQGLVENAVKELECAKTEPEAARRAARDAVQEKLVVLARCMEGTCVDMDNVAGVIVRRVNPDPKMESDHDQD